jgi:TRAP-type mannitol/chloroaromatic compound transport system substrate-binding protein
VRSAAARLNVWMLSEFETKNAQYLAKIRAETNVEIRALPQDVIDKLKEISQQVIEELASANPLNQKIYDSLKAFKKEASGWAEISEKVFYNSV